MMRLHIYSYVLLFLALASFTQGVPSSDDWLFNDDQAYLAEASAVLASNADLVLAELEDAIPNVGAHLPMEFGGSFGEIPETRDPVSCATCMLLFGVVNAAIENDLGFDDVRDEVLGVCLTIFNNTNAEIICEGIIDNYGPPLFVIMETKPAGAREVCTFYQNCDESDVEPSEEPPAMKQSDSQRPMSTPRERKPDWKENSLRIMHLTDIHVDEKYLEGSATDCGLPVCCHEDYPGEGSAGYWGSYSCNAPPRTTEAFLEYLSQLDPPPDYLIYTGDSPPHTLWEETLESQESVTRWVAQTLHSHLPQMDAYPVFGNHEYFPANLFYVDDPDTQAIHEEFARVWQPSAKWSPEQRDNVEYAGFYTMQITPGLRILSFNTNYGYDFNWYNWLNIDNQDYEDTKQFMRNTLADAREHGDKVVMAYHHPSGSGTLPDWAEFMRDIMLEYHDVITLQVSGHTHRDEFRVLNDPEDGSAKTVQYVGGTMNTRSNINPNARLFYLDPDTFEVLDYQHFALDISASREASWEEPPFYHVYTASEEYGLADLSPASWYDLTVRFETDQDLLNKYYSNRNGNTGDAQCGVVCRRRELCRIRSATTAAYDECMD